MEPAVLYLLLGLWWSRDLDLGLERLDDDATECAGCEGILADMRSGCIARDCRDWRRSENVTLLCNNNMLWTQFLTLSGCQQVIRKSVRCQIAPGMIGEAVLWLAICNRSRFTFRAKVRPQFVQRRRLFHRVHPGPLAVSAVGWYLIPILKEQHILYNVFCRFID